MAEPDVDALREAYAALSRRVVEDRLAFADRVQEMLDQAQHLQRLADERERENASLRRELEALRDDAAALRSRVASLHEELIEAHRNAEALEQSRSFRYTAPLRRIGGAIRGR